MFNLKNELYHSPATAAAVDALRADADKWFDEYEFWAAHHAGTAAFKPADGAWPIVVTVEDLAAGAERDRAASLLFLTRLVGLRSRLPAIVAAMQAAAAAAAQAAPELVKLLESNANNLAANEAEIERLTTKEAA